MKCSVDVKAGAGRSSEQASHKRGANTSNLRDAVATLQPRRMRRPFSPANMAFKGPASL